MQCQTALTNPFLTAVLLFYLFTSSLSHAVSSDPEVGKQLFADGEIEKALAVFKNVHKVYANYGTGIGYAYHLGAAGKTKEAIDLFERLIKNNPKEHVADIELANLYKKLERYEEAEAVLARLYERIPNNIEVVKSYAGGLLATRKIDTAITVIESYSPQEGEEFDYTAIAAAVYFEAQDYQSARDLYRSLTEMRPELIGFWVSLGKCYRKLKAYETSKQFYSELKEQFPNSGEPWLESGGVFWEVDDLGKAEEEFQTAKQKFSEAGNFPKRDIAQQLINEIQFEQGRRIMSRGDFINACPRMYEVYVRNSSYKIGFTTAICYREAKMFDVAKILFIDLVHQHPDDSALFIEYYDTLKMMEDMKSAKQILLDFVGKDGYKNVKVVSRLAGMYLVEENYQAALDVLVEGRQHLNKDESPLAFLFIAGNALQGLKKYKQADVVFEKARKQAPDLLETHIALFNSVNKSGVSAESQVLLIEMFEQFGLSPKVLIQRATLNLIEENWEKVIEDCIAIKEHPSLKNEDDPNEYKTADALIEEATIGIAKNKHKMGEAVVAADMYRQLYFNNPTTRNALNLAFMASVIGESYRTETILKTTLAKEPDNMVIKLIWGQMLLSEHRAPELLELLGMNVGKDHIYKHGFSEMVVKALMEMGRWEDLKLTFDAIRQQTLHDELGEDLPFTGEIPESMLGIEAIYFLNTDNIDKAIEVNQKLYELKPTVSAFPLELANLYLQVGKEDEARRMYQEVLKRFPDDASVWLSYAKYQLKQGDKDGWRNAGDRAIALIEEKVEDNFWVELERQMSLANASFSMGQSEKAKEILLRITQEQPYYYNAHTLLAYVYLANKDVYQALRSFKRALDLQPNNPFAITAVTTTYMQAMDPSMSRYWEERSIPKVYQMNGMVRDIKKGSLGVNGYRPLPYFGTFVDIASLSARPNALMLVRENAFSDLPIGGFQIDQTIYKQNFGFFGPDTPAFWLNYSRISSSGSIDTIGNIFEFALQKSYISPKGVLQIFPSFTTLFEKKKYAQTPAILFPIGTLKATFTPKGTNLLLQNKTDYGLQRLDKYGNPTEFIFNSTGIAYSKGTNSLAQSVSLRRDNAASGLSFNTVASETAGQYGFGNLVVGGLFNAVYITDLPKLGDVFGYDVMAKAEYNFKNKVYPYTNYTVSRSKAYQFNETIQLDTGFSFQGSFSAKTREVNRWYKYDIPFSIKIAYQQYFYPNSTIPETKTFMFAFRII